MLDVELATVFPRMVGGNPAAFFQHHWRKRVHFAPGALPELLNTYDLDAFVADYRQLNFHGATLLITVDEQGQRRMRRPQDADAIHAALMDGSPVVLQTLLAQAFAPELPKAWSSLIALYDGLRQHLLPNFPAPPAAGDPVAAVDIFCATGKSTTGGHYDTGDVFYFVLEGERDWTLELEPDPTVAYPLLTSSTGYLQDRTPRGATHSVRVRPGDCLYVPPHTYHRVHSTERSLAVSFGLPTFTEVSMLTTLLAEMQGELALHAPLPSFPATLARESKAAADETAARTSNLLRLLAERLKNTTSI